MILILTCKQDSHADEVIRNLHRRNTPVFRLNTEDLLLRYKVEIGISATGWFGTVSDELGRTLDLAGLKVAWLRKPSFEFNLLEPVPKGEVDFICAEARSFIEILYSLPSITWVNDPFVSSKSRIKFQQLLLAVQMGIDIPRTVITNQPDRASTFFESCGRSVATKAIYNSNVFVGGVNRGLLTSKVDGEEFDEAVESIKITPTQLQEYVSKAFELRVTVIGKKVFAVKIDSQLNEETQVDWRARTGLNPHSDFELPSKIESFCLAFLELQGLHFGAMDFIVTPDDKYVFLENNPHGQYQWLEYETQQPLADEICNLLEDLSQRC